MMRWYRPWANAVHTEGQAGELGETCHLQGLHFSKVIYQTLSKHPLCVWHSTGYGKEQNHTGLLLWGKAEHVVDTVRSEKGTGKAEGEGVRKEERRQEGFVRVEGQRRKIENQGDQVGRGTGSSSGEVDLNRSFFS